MLSMLINGEEETVTGVEEYPSPHPPPKDPLVLLPVPCEPRVRAQGRGKFSIFLVHKRPLLTKQQDEMALFCGVDISGK